MVSERHPSLDDALTEALDISARRIRSHSHHESADARTVVRDEILPALRSGRLTVFVGAGVSYANGFPGWSALLERLSAQLVPDDLRSAFDLIASHGSPLVTARFLRHQLGVRALFSSFVHAALYGPDVDYNRPNGTLDFIVALAHTAHIASAPLRIMTYNFDDLVEDTLRTRYPDVIFETITSEATAHRATAPVRIYHVHGFLPAHIEGPKELWPEVILAEEAFNDLMSAPAKWANREQSAAFANDHCVFVGLSMADPNLRRLLDTAGAPVERRHSIFARAYQAGDRFVPTADPMNRAAAEHLNEIEGSIAETLGAARILLPDHQTFADLASQIRGAL